MSVELIVCRLSSGHIDSADQWLIELGKYFKFAFGDEETVKIRTYSGNPSDALWLGTPLLFVGEIKDVQRFVHHLPPQSRLLFDDCAYYWVLSESDRYLLAKDRTVTLDWHYKQFEVIASRLKLLLKFPRLAGLSRGMHAVRTEISRLAVGKKGPWTPVLILGESGTGKEEVARSLYKSIDHNESQKDPNNFKPMACGAFNKELLLSQLFGIGPGVATGVDGKKGILELGSNGCVFLDDYDTAMDLIQAPLLRVMSEAEGEEAGFYRLGEENIPGKEVKTSVWLMFSTNADITSLLEKGVLREDFLFRFQDRVLRIAPLRERPADIPAISRLIWGGLGSKRALSPLTLQQVFEHKTTWAGNVRALKALLSLAVSMSNLPSHNQYPQREIFKEVMDRGQEYYHWVGIIASPSFTGPFMPGDRDVQAILELDNGHYCYGLTKKQTGDSESETVDPDDECSPSPKNLPLTGSEEEARAKLNTVGRKALENALKNVEQKRGKGQVVRPGVRLSRIIVYVARQKQVDRLICVELCGIKNSTADADLKSLAAAGLLKVKEKSADQSIVSGQEKDKLERITVYERVEKMFEPLASVSKLSAG